jgi:PIN domain nuclease of toxin-antitoxin system
VEGEIMNLYLDTHVVVWLYEGLVKLLSDQAIKLIENHDVIISPMVELELVYLYETKKITRTAHVIIHELQSRIGLAVCDIPFEAVVNKAASLSWARDPFDRLIVAQSLCGKSKFLTKDRVIRKHCKSAVWN